MIFMAPAVAGYIAAIPDKGHPGSLSGRLQVDIGSSVGRPVARAMCRLSASVCPVAGTADHSMLTRVIMPPFDIRECVAIRPAIAGGRPMAGTAAIARTELGMAPLAVGGRADRDRIVPPVTNGIGMAAANDAVGEGRGARRTHMGRAREGEAVGYYWFEGGEDVASSGRIAIMGVARGAAPRAGIVPVAAT